MDGPLGRTLGQILELWPQALALLMLAIDIWASAHAILTKRDARATIVWVGFIWLVPVLGTVLYVLFGINRIRKRASALRGRRGGRRPAASALPPSQLPSSELPSSELPSVFPSTSGEALARALPETASGEAPAHLATLARLVGDVTGRPLLAGNRIVPYREGREAYAAMLGAIEEAEASVSLTTYIMDNDRAGRLFLEALRRAVARGVEVRVIIDDVGARYSWPTIVRSMRRAGVPVAKFLPRLMPWSLRYANLRNHRKVLVVDGRIGFTGGMNIREGHSSEFVPPHPIQDLHVRLDGPVVAQLQEVIVDDWLFSTGEVLEGERWFPPLEPAGSVLARGIPDGPDEDFEKLRLTLLGALACARSSVRIVTPYFLPDEGLITSLNVAALRGVEVDILLPRQNNLRLVQWASTALLWQVLERGCRVWHTPPPFDHSKLMLVDGLWTLLGSANWDPRSLRLNFEFSVESYDRDLAGTLEAWVQAKLREAQPVTLADVDGRPLPIRLRDGVAKLLFSYL